MSEFMEYKDYVGLAKYSSEDKVFHGKIEFIRDLVTFEGETAAGLEQSFHEAVDDYLAFCEKKGRAPDKPFKGSFNIRTGPDLHRRAMMAAKNNGINLNAFVVQALETYLSK